MTAINVAAVTLNNAPQGRLMLAYYNAQLYGITDAAGTLQVFNGINAWSSLFTGSGVGVITCAAGTSIGLFIGTDTPEVYKWDGVTTWASIGFAAAYAGYIPTYIRECNGTTIITAHLSANHQNCIIISWDGTAFTTLGSLTVPSGGWLEPIGLSGVLYALDSRAMVLYSVIGGVLTAVTGSGGGYPADDTQTGFFRFMDILNGELYLFPFTLTTTTLQKWDGSGAWTSVSGATGVRGTSILSAFNTIYDINSTANKQIFKWVGSAINNVAAITTGQIMMTIAAGSRAFFTTWTSGTYGNLWEITEAPPGGLNLGFLPAYPFAST